MTKVSLIGKKDIENIVDSRTDNNLSFIDAEIKESKNNIETLKQRIALLEYRLTKLEEKSLSKQKGVTKFGRLKK